MEANVQDNSRTSRRRQCGLTESGSQQNSVEVEMGTRRVQTYTKCQYRSVDVVVVKTARTNYSRSQKRKQLQQSGWFLTLTTYLEDKAGVAYGRVTAAHKP